jgi:hypothetical protein
MQELPIPFSSEGAQGHPARLWTEKVHLLQKLLKILAALSLSLSKVVGQNASLPILLDSLLTGAPSLSAHPHTLSKPFLLPDFVLSQDGSIEVTLCIVKSVLTSLLKTKSCSFKG